MKKYILIILLGTLSSLVLAVSPTVQMTIRVIDDENKPVPNALVGMGGGLETLDKGGVSRKANGQVNAKGEFTEIIASLFGRVGAFAEKEGYYRTEHDYIKLYKTQKEFEEAQKSGKWHPWNQTLNVVIKPIKNPVPMYAKNVTEDIPVKDQWIGYDLQVGDWVNPHGKGVKSDFLFYAKGEVQSDLNYQAELQLKFSEKGDGILPYEIDIKNRSQLKMPYQAPQEGYQSIWIWKNSRFTENKPYAISEFVDESNPDYGFIFRVRSVTDVNGKIISAYYGKIHGPFTLDPRGTEGHCFISFTYYFNPNKTQNLEFDTKRNLFSDQDIQQP